MPLRRTFSGLTQDFNKLTKQNERLQRQRDEALEAAQEVKTKNKRLKKALQKEKQQRAESPVEKLIPMPNGQAGRKTTIDRNGRTRLGFSLRTEMGLDRPNNKKTYNEFREFVRQAAPGNRYQNLDDMGPLVIGAIASKTLKKFPFLSKFQGHWPVKVVLQSYFTNRKNYKTDGRKRKRASGLDDESDNDQGGAAGGDEGESDDDDSGPRGSDAMRPGGEEGGEVTDDEEEEPVIKTRKRKAIVIDDSEDDHPYASKRHQPNSRTPSFDPQGATPVEDSDTEGAAGLAKWYRDQRKAESAVEKQTKATKSQSGGTRRSTRQK